MDIFSTADKAFVLFTVSGVTGADEISKVPGTCKRMYSNSSTKKFYLNKKKPSVYDPNYFLILYSVC